MAQGFSAEDYEEDELLVWPEHARALHFFMDQCQTQWRSGMGGATGLDYTAILAAIEFEEPDRAQARELFEQIRCIERGALEEMGKRK